jgi:hypothetical protein
VRDRFIGVLIRQVILAFDGFTQMQMHTDYSAKELEEFSKKKLQEICRHYRVGTSGNKSVLVDRILHIQRGGRQRTLDGFLTSKKV